MGIFMNYHTQKGPILQPFAPILLLIFPILLLIGGARGPPNKEQNGGKKFQNGAFLGYGNSWKYPL